MVFRIDSPSAVAVRPTPQALATQGYFGRGNLGTGQLPTVVTADWANMVQEELIAIVVQAGLTPSKTVVNQVLSALQMLFHPLSGAVGLDFVARKIQVYDAGGSGGGGSIYSDASATGPYNLILRSGSSGNKFLILGANGDVFASNGKLRAATGARGSADANCATLLADFTSVDGTTGNECLPDGRFIQWATGSANAYPKAVTFPTSFPVACHGVLAIESTPSGTWGAGNPTVYAGDSISAGGFNMCAMQWNGSAFVGASGGTPLGFRYFAWGK